MGGVKVSSSEIRAVRFMLCPLTRLSQEDCHTWSDPQDSEGGDEMDTDVTLSTDPATFEPQVSPELLTYVSLYCSVTQIEFGFCPLQQEVLVI